MRKIGGTLVLFLVITQFAALAQTFPTTIYGIYGSPGPLWKEGYTLPDLGINAIFVRSQSIDSTLMKRATDENQLVFAEFATLNGKHYVDQHPEAWAINQQGEKVTAASWFMGVCPTEPGFRAYRQKLLHELMQKYEIDGVWLDYIHWHAQFEEEKPILPETCFCNHCLDRFQTYAHLKLPAGEVREKAHFILSNHETEWRQWRCEVIKDWVVDLKAIMKSYNPDGLLGLYHCPWTDDEYGGARRKILGLDYDLLTEVVDVFSPMVYHERMQRSAAWVGKNLNWHTNRLKIGKPGSPLLWPIVQAHQVPAHEFGAVMKTGLSGGSTGIMMFTSSSIAEDPEKLELVKKIYLK